MARRSPSPVLAAGLSLLAPGLGHLYAGRVGWGVFWLVVTPGFWLTTGGCLGWICHLVAAIHAWSLSERS